MVIIENRPGLKTQDVKPERMSRPSDRHQVILLQPINRNIPCTACLLRTVFQMTDEQAQKHAERARKTGAEPVYVSFPEMVETKAKLANETAKERGITCHPRVRQVSFTTQPAP